MTFNRLPLYLLVPALSACTEDEPPKCTLLVDWKPGAAASGEVAVSYQSAARRAPTTMEAVVRVSSDSTVVFDACGVSDNQAWLLNTAWSNLPASDALPTDMSLSDPSLPVLSASLWPCDGDVAGDACLGSPSAPAFTTAPKPDQAGSGIARVDEYNPALGRFSGHATVRSASSTHDTTDFALRLRWEPGSLK